MEQIGALQLYNTFKDKIETNDYEKQISDLINSIQNKFEAIITKVEEEDNSRTARLEHLKYNIQQVLNHSWRQLQAYNQKYAEKLQERNKAWPQVDAKMQAFAKIKTIFWQSFINSSKSNP